MEKSLNVYSYLNGNDKVIKINHSFELDNRKSRLCVSKGERESYQKKIKAIHDKFKTSSNYVGTFLSFDTLDSYTHDVNMYYVPYFGIHKGERSVTVGENDYGFIPKDWSEELTIVFKNCKQYGAVLKAVKALGYTLDDKEVKELKKALKDGKKQFEKFVE